MSQYKPGAVVPIQVKVVKADLPRVEIEVSIDGRSITYLEEPYVMEWVFEEEGDHTISVKGYSDGSYWSDDEVVVTIGTGNDGQDDEEDASQKDRRQRGLPRQSHHQLQ